MGYIDTNRAIAIAGVSLLILLFIWKVPVMGSFEWNFMQKIMLSVASIGIVSFLVWRREG